MNWITREIAVGSARELNERFLLGQGVTHVLVVGKVILPKFVRLKVAVIPWHDEGSLSRLYDALRFIDSAVEEGAVFVCCPAGIERSPLTVVAYLIWKGYSVEEAVDLVKGRRPQSFIHLEWLRDVGFI